MKYYQKVVRVNGEQVIELKFQFDKLMRMYVAEQLGHNKVATNNEYRSETARARRTAFRTEMKKRRK
ncbi:hypothetical protein [Paenibacillus sp. IHBB 10380]|uniref:hypothetical protein n=1 Tax=Paenibacillus sp. IHBB 10380 TaxID=1566358 RepID=UPI0005CFEB7F|nr:hypothetical protein [Paenibacillus sp. IHBB 10380]AJS58565.1 hypothetical protein UB51_08755 [Paenibacillus sp. IHBB 10380]